MHVRGNEHVCDLFKLVLLNSNVVGEHYIGSFSRKSAFKVESHGRVVVTLLLFDLSSLGLLTGFKKPREVVLFKFGNVLVLVLFSNLDAFVPSMKLLVHGHGFFDLVVLDKDCLCLMELFVEHSHLSLHSKVVWTLRGDQLVKFSQVVSFGDITKGSIAALSNVQVGFFHG